MIYEMECLNCKEITEFWCKISERPDEIDCPVCNNGKAKRIVSIPSKPKPIFYNVPDIPTDSSDIKEGE